MAAQPLLDSEPYKGWIRGLHPRSQRSNDRRQKAMASLFCLHQCTHRPRRAQAQPPRRGLVPNPQSHASGLAGQNPESFKLSGCFKTFEAAYKVLTEKLRRMVYGLGFLRG